MFSLQQGSEGAYDFTCPSKSEDHFVAASVLLRNLDAARKQQEDLLNRIACEEDRLAAAEPLFVCASYDRTTVGRRNACKQPKALNERRSCAQRSVVIQNSAFLQSTSFRLSFDSEAKKGPGRSPPFKPHTD